jgi:hypothetical protein
MPSVQIPTAIHTFISPSVNLNGLAAFTIEFQLPREGVMQPSLKLNRLISQLLDQLRRRASVGRFPRQAALTKELGVEIDLNYSFAQPPKPENASDSLETSVACSGRPILSIARSSLLAWGLL